MLKLYFLALFIFISFSVNAQYYDTLPKGIRTVVYRHIKSEVNSSYNKSQSETPYSYEIEANIENLEKIDEPTLQEALELFKDYPEAYEQISLGTHKIEANADLNVEVFGFGYGVTDRITAYVGVPIYKAKVNLNYKRIKKDTLEDVANSLQDEQGDDFAQTLGNAVENLYAVDEGLIQSAFVNALNYDELGSWEGQGLGDTELGLMYNFVREDNYGLMVTFGAIAPTGYVDDPDLVQDIGFGDGQWDLFTEFGGGYIFNPQIIVNAWTRLTYQFASKKDLRAPFTEETDLSPETKSFREKLGNKIEVGSSIDLNFNDWFKLQPGYKVNYTEEAKYESSDSFANKALAKNSESYAQSFQLQAQLSTIGLYQQKKFLIPAQFKASFQQILEGKNTPKADLFQIEMRMFF